MSLNKNNIDVVGYVYIEIHKIFNETTANVSNIRFIPQSISMDI